MLVGPVGPAHMWSRVLSAKSVGSGRCVRAGLVPVRVRSFRLGLVQQQHGPGPAQPVTQGDAVWWSCCMNLATMLPQSTYLTTMCLMTSSMAGQTFPLSFSWAAYQLHLLLPCSANHGHSLWFVISSMGTFTVHS